MRANEGQWYCASFDRTPDLGVLHELHNAFAPRIPLFFARNVGFAVTLYLPPEAARFVEIANADRRLKRFEPCAKPIAAVHLLFGDEATASRHFPPISNVLRFRKSELPD